MEGYNAVIFAYGQTASGKTYTLTGDADEPGIIPRSMKDVFAFIRRTPTREYLLRCSYLEIYNESIHDLLAPPGSSQTNPVQIQGAAGGDIILTPLREEVVTSLKGVRDVLKRGEAHRRTACTDWNERSSRSHSVFRLVIESRERGNPDAPFEAPKVATPTGANGRHTPGLGGRQTPGMSGRQTPGAGAGGAPGGPRLQARGGRSVQTSVLVRSSWLFRHKINLLTDILAVVSVESHRSCRLREGYQRQGADAGGEVYQYQVSLLFVSCLWRTCPILKRSIIVCLPWDPSLGLSQKTLPRGNRTSIPCLLRVLVTDISISAIMSPTATLSSHACSNHP